MWIDYIGLGLVMVLAVVLVMRDYRRGLLPWPKVRRLKPGDRDYFPFC